MTSVALPTDRALGHCAARLGEQARGDFPSRSSGRAPGKAVRRFAAHWQSAPTCGLALVFDTGEFLVIRKARAVWRGSGRAGNGDLSTDSGSALTLRASVPNLDQDTFDRLAQDAEQNCPVSRVLRAEITLDAKLV